MAALDAFLTDPDAKSKILAHKTIAGHIGGSAQQIAQRLVEQQQKDADEKASQKQLKQMMKEAEDNPQAFAEKWLKGIKADKSAKEVAELRSTVEEEFGKRIGTAVAAIPEFSELSSEEVTSIAASMAGRPKEEVLGAYTRAVVDKIADKRAAKLLASWKERDLDTEAKARVKEQNARRLASQKGPGISPPSRGARGSDEPKYGSPEWDQWYERTVLKRPPSLTAAR